MNNRTRWAGLLASLLVLALLLAACGGDEQDEEQATSATEPAPAVTADSGSGGELNLGGPSLTLGGGSGLPGCNDPNDTECPAPLQLDLDGSASAGGVTLQYPTRYFTATTPAAGDLLIEVGPKADGYPFDEQATFQVYFAGSIDEALAALTEPITADWQAGALSGRIGVVKDRTLDPPVNTTIGAFDTGDGRVIVLKLVTTGKYGWDLYSRVFEDMLNTLAIAPPGG